MRQPENRSSVRYPTNLMIPVLYNETELFPRLSNYLTFVTMTSERWLVTV
jgi:hypothetical protein